MTQTPETSSRQLFRKITRLRGWTALALLSEKLAAVLWPPLTCIAAFAALSLLNIHHVLISFAFLAAFLFSLYRGLRNFYLPSREDIDRRLETQSGVTHRPLAALTDTLANPHKEETEQLWQIGRQSLSRSLQKLKPSLPRPVVSALDPFALRVGVFVLLIAAIGIAGPLWPQRLKDGVRPLVFSLPVFMDDDVATLTIIPPSYTGIEKITLSGKGGDQIADIPAGSQIKALVTGGVGTPKLVMGDTELPLVRTEGTDSYGIETNLGEADQISIRQFGFTRLKWKYHLVPDTAPQISLNGDPVPLPSGEIRIPLKLYDDYGVRDVAVQIDLDPSVTPPPIGEPYKEKRAVMTRGGDTAEIEPVFDFSFHPWAGMKAVITVTAIDDLGQKTEMTPFQVILPEKNFANPVAQKVIAIRKLLLKEPKGVKDVQAMELIRLSSHPELFQGNIVTYMALLTAGLRLHRTPGMETSKALVNMLWQIAVNLEDGGLTTAMQRLRQAREALENALNDPKTSPEEIAHLTQNLREAMAEYFQEMAREIQRRAQNGQMQMLPSDMLSQLLRPEDMQQFFDQLQAEAMNGDKDSARELLSQLSQMMDNMNSSMSAQMPQEMQDMMEGMNQLKELIDRQKDLIDETSNLTSAPVAPLPLEDMPARLRNLFSQLEQQIPTPLHERPMPRAMSADTTTQKGKQEDLRMQLGALMAMAAEAMGNVPENMGLAEIEMRGSTKALSKNDLFTSLPHQQKAVEHLEDSMEEMRQQLMQMMKQMTGIAFGPAPTDPMGRPYDGEGGKNPFFGSKVKIPDEATRKKVEEILDILRQRSGEYSRPEEERDYYRRLLKQF